MRFDFNNKNFRVIKNDGPDAEVTEETVFHFKQEDNVVHADYYGGKVKMGKFIGIIEDNEIHFKYHQVNLLNEFNSGHSKDQIELTENKKIRLIDEWEWETETRQGILYNGGNLTN